MTYVISKHKVKPYLTKSCYKRPSQANFEIACVVKIIELFSINLKINVE